MEKFWIDLKFAFRMLAKAKAFTVIAVVTLALGIGANTAIFSVIKAVLLTRLPYRNSDRLVMVFERSFINDAPKNVVNPGNFLAWKERSRNFEDFAAYFPFAYDGNIVGAGEPQHVAVGLMTGNMLSTVGVKPLIGRDFLPEETKPGTPDVILLSESYWRQRYGSDPNVLGRTVTLNGQPAPIIGVLPASFEIPAHMDMWIPYALPTGANAFGGRYLHTVGRLKPGVSVQQAQAELDTIAASLSQEHPGFDTGWGVNVVSFREQVVGGLRTPLLVLLGAVAMVLLIACTNIASLLMVRASARQREIAIRIALGVTRTRLARQLLTESVLLSFLGGVLGLLFAGWGLAALLSIAPAELPHLAPVTIDSSVLLFTFGVTLLTGVGFGLGPVLQATKTHWGATLKETGHTSRYSTRRGVRNVFVIAEAAVALILLVGAGLLIRSFVRLMNVDPGFRSEKVLTMQVSLPRFTYREPAKQLAFFNSALEQIKALPGVESVGATSFLPLSGLGSATVFTVDDRPKPAPGQEPVGDVRNVSADYFRAMGISLLQGRFFSQDDRAEDKVKKIIINENMAHKFWPNQDPIGKRISMDWGDMLHAEVVGVVKDVMLDSLDESRPRLTLYWYLPQFPSRNPMTFAVHATGDPNDLVQPIRRVIASIDPNQAISQIRTIDVVVSDSVRSPRFLAVILGNFAALALLLASVGIYGVISYTVAQRTHEIGIRMAFGARPLDIRRMVLGEGLGLIGIGLVIGVVGALALTRLLASLLFQVGTTDPITFVSVAGILTAVGILACYAPAARATRVEPVVALHHE